MRTIVQYQKDILIIQLHIQPNGRQDCWAGRHGGTAIKVKVAASAVDGAANEQLCRFLATQFQVAKSKIKLIKGEQSRQKLVEVHNPKIVPEKLLLLLSPEERQELIFLA